MVISRIHQQGVFANKNAVSILQSGLHILVLAINALSLQNSSHVSYNTEITFSQDGTLVRYFKKLFDILQLQKKISLHQVER